MEHRAHGAMAYRSIACLPSLVGAWRERGGGLLYMTAGLHLAALNAEAVMAAEDLTVRFVNMVQLGRALTDPRSIRRSRRSSSGMPTLRPRPLTNAWCWRVCAG